MNTQQNSGRYILFEIPEYYPVGGMGDAIGDFHTIEEAQAKYQRNKGVNSFSLYDRLTHEYVDLKTLERMKVT